MALKILFFMILGVSLGLSEETSEDPLRITINPDEHIFGIPLFSSEEQVKEALGEPLTRIEFKKKLIGLIYRRNFTLFMSDKGLCGVIAQDYPMIASNLTYRFHDQRYTRSPSNRNPTWMLTNGLYADISKEDVLKLIPKNKRDENYSVITFDTAKSEIAIYTSTRTINTKEIDFVYKVWVMEKSAFRKYQINFNP